MMRPTQRGDTVAEELTGRTLLLFDEQATLTDFADFQSFLLNETDLKSFEDVDISPEFLWRFSQAYHIGVAPVSPSNVSMRRHGKFGIIAVAPERYLHTPVRARNIDGTPHIAEEPLKRIGVRTSPATGAAIRVAVLDSGVSHPDLTARLADRKSFIKTNAITLPHGTLCAGVICGPRTIGTAFGYGIASDTVLFDGQVMGDTNVVADDTLLRAIEWADQSKKADVIVVAAGAQTATNEPNPIYEHVGRLLLDGSSARLLIAAAGEGSYVAGSSPVEHPANCESIVAVGSVDGKFVPMSSTPGFIAGGDIVDFVAPGFELPSTSIAGGKPSYATISGTSAAVAVAAGVACLWAQTRVNLRGAELWQAMSDAAEILPNSSFRTVGAGLVKAPQ